MDMRVMVLPDSVVADIDGLLCDAVDAAERDAMVRSRVTARFTCQWNSEAGAVEITCDLGGAHGRKRIGFVRSGQLKLEV